MKLKGLFSLIIGLIGIIYTLDARSEIGLNSSINLITSNQEELDVDSDFEYAFFPLFFESLEVEVRCESTSNFDSLKSSRSLPNYFLENVGVDYLPNIRKRTFVKYYVLFHSWKSHLTS